MKHLKKHKLSKISVGVFFSLIAVLPITLTTPVYAGTTCGVGPGAVVTAIDLGCTGTVSNPILDMVFGILRFLSAGVGIVVVASIVIAGIQFTLARDNPQNVEAAVSRIRSSLFALVIFIFAYAILNYLVPGGLFT
jgi:hypothetical protein